jgi:hypothetical protein
VSAEAAGAAARAEDREEEAPEIVVLVVSELDVPDTAALADVAESVLEVEWVPVRLAVSPATPTTVTTPVTMRAPRAG